MPALLFVQGGQQPTTADLVLFGGDQPEVRPLELAEGIAPVLAAGQPLWLRIRGLGQDAAILQLLRALRVPGPLLGPLLEHPQRPRVDCFGEAVLVVLHRLQACEDPLVLTSLQVGLLLLPGMLITVEEAADGGSFPHLTAWLQSGAGEVGDRDLDDILHFLIDDLLDDLFPILERIGNRLDELEEQVLPHPTPRLLSRTIQYRANVRTVRRLIWPLRYQIHLLLRQRNPLLGAEAREGFEEMAEMVELLFENTELLRNHCDAITQAYAATVGNRMNQVMKTLTILTSVFAPLTFIAGIYGMNFQVMPELTWRYGYLSVLLLMVLVAVLQVWWLGRRGWFQDWTTPRRAGRF